jgi:hypothetical protein
MLVITVIAVFVGAASLAAGLAVRWRLARCPVAPAALPGTARQPGIGTLDRWRGMSRTLLSPERGMAGEPCCSTSTTAARRHLQPPRGSCGPAGCCQGPG